VNVGRDFAPSLVADISEVAAGDPCPECGTGLALKTGVEIAASRQPVTTLQEPPGFVTSDGAWHPAALGSYQVFPLAILAAVAEAHHDDRGLCWPRSVAPFEVHLCLLEEHLLPLAERIYETFSASGVAVLFDDRLERPGVQFADADRIGLPVRIVASRRSLEGGGVEVKCRNEAAGSVVTEDACLGFAISRLSG
jgi:prolyl-tRNA synthetase